MITAKIAPAGSVTTHETTMFLTMLILIAAIPRAKPPPMIAPTMVLVVELGNPVPDAKTTVEAVANWAAKPRLGVRAVMPEPTVLITL